MEKKDKYNLRPRRNPPGSSQHHTTQAVNHTKNTQSDLNKMQVMAAIVRWRQISLKTSYISRNTITTIQSGYSWVWRLNFASMPRPINKCRVACSRLTVTLPLFPPAAPPTINLTFIERPLSPGVPQGRI